MDARSPGSGLGVWSPGKPRRGSTLVRAVSRPDPAVKRGSRGATCATSAASNLASSRTKGIATPPSLRRMQRLATAGRAKTSDDLKMTVSSSSNYHDASETEPIHGKCNRKPSRPQQTKAYSTVYTPLPLARKIRVFQKSSRSGFQPDRVAVSAARSGERAKNSAGGTAATPPTPPAAA